jgi:ATP-dependent Clp protease ATP-binding subunit ClpB
MKNRGLTSQTPNFTTDWASACFMFRSSGGGMTDTTTKHIVLEPGRHSDQVNEFERKLRSRFVGQDEAVSQLVNVYQTVLAGMVIPDRPIASLLFLGPTGSGKTRLVEAAAEILLGSPKAVVKVDCGEFQFGHEISKLVGSPPGYIGHRETQPIFTQEAFDSHHTEQLKLSFLLFDEIEKAGDSLWRLLLGILDKATVTLGDNRRVDLSRTIVVMTSNLGASEMSRLASGSIGFAPRTGAESAGFDQRIYRVGVEAAKRRFSPEFMNRIDKVVVFRTLTREQLAAILDIELRNVQERILTPNAAHIFAFHCTPRAKEFVLKEGTDARYGARHLKRAIERHIVFPLSGLMSTGQIETGETITVDVAEAGNELVFTKDEQPVPDPPQPEPDHGELQHAASGSGLFFQRSSR